jgi:hypothetical protein
MPAEPNCPMDSSCEYSDLPPLKMVHISTRLTPLLLTEETQSKDSSGRGTSLSDRQPRLSFMPRRYVLIVILVLSAAE